MSVVVERLTTQSLGLDIEALGLVVGAEGGVVCEHGYVDPGRRVPVRVVVALLRALVATPIPVGVLAGVDGGAHSKVVGAEVLVSRKEAWGQGSKWKGERGDAKRIILISLRLQYERPRPPKEPQLFFNTLVHKSQSFLK